MIVKFRYVDLERVALARPPGYLQEVLRLGWRKGFEVCMEQEVYRMLCLKYSPTPSITPMVNQMDHPVEQCCGKEKDAMPVQ